MSGTARGPRRPLRFGVFLSPAAGRHDDLVAQARTAEAAGLDLIGIQDHPYHPGFLDAFVLAGQVLAHTSRIRVFPDVANLPLRPPAMLAKAAASLDVVSGGRFELGLGAGAMLDGAAAMGAPRRTPGEAVEAVDEAFDILRQAWRADGPVHHAGRHHRLDGYPAGPPPAHPVGIWLGAYRPRMLDLTGRRADGWVPSYAFLPPPAAGEAQGRVDEAARRAGRDPAAITRVYNVDGHIGEAPSAGTPVSGAPKVWTDLLVELAVDTGFDTFVLAPAGDVAEQIERYATDVVPRVRRAVEGAPPPPVPAAAEAR